MVFEPPTATRKARRATRGSAIANSAHVDAVNRRIPPDATASNGIRRVEVAGIEAAGTRRVALARRVDLRER
jgi:hypothetical protein